MATNDEAENGLDPQSNRWQSCLIGLTVERVLQTQELQTAPRQGSAISRKHHSSRRDIVASTSHIGIWYRPPQRQSVLRRHDQCTRSGGEAVVSSGPIMGCGSMCPALQQSIICLLHCVSPPRFNPSIRWVHSGETVSIVANSLLRLCCQAFRRTTLQPCRLPSTHLPEYVRVLTA